MAHHPEAFDFNKAAIFVLDNPLATNELRSHCTGILNAHSVGIGKSTLICIGLLRQEATGDINSYLVLCFTHYWILSGSLRAARRDQVRCARDIVTISILDLSCCCCGLHSTRPQANYAFVQNCSQYSFRRLRSLRRRSAGGGGGSGRSFDCGLERAPALRSG